MKKNCSVGKRVVSDIPNFLLHTFKNVLQPNNKQIIKTDEGRFHQRGHADGKETYEMMYSIFGIREGKFKPH